MNFDGSWIVGAAGTFLSPLKSPLAFFPLVILLPVALAVLLWRRDRVAWFAVIFLLPQVYLMPKYSMWDGGPDLFSRFWLRGLPIVFLCLAAAIPAISQRRRINGAFFALALALTALGTRTQLLSVMTDERDVYAHVAGDLNARLGSGHELEYHDSAANLIAGRTVVSDAQVAGISEPRRFLWFRSVPVPTTTRLWVAVVGLLASGLSLLVMEGLWKRRRAVLVSSRLP